MKKLSVICLLVVGFILISGCIDEEKINSKTSTDSQSSINETSKDNSASPSISIPTPLILGEFDINITSYYFVYLRDNYVFYENIRTPTLDLVEKNYVIYHLSIKNNDTNALNFSINKLQLHAGNQIFTPADPGTILEYSIRRSFPEIQKENKLNDTLLHPDQNLEGIVIFQVDNYNTLFDRSFSLRYNTTPIPSTSYEKSLEALTVAEQFDYSIAFDIPPYEIMNEGNSYDPPEPRVSFGNTWYSKPGNEYFWANWVNRSVFESYKKYDEILLPKQKPGNIPSVDISYAVKVIPKQDLTVFQNTSVPHYTQNGEENMKIQMCVVDDTGEELFNKSSYIWDEDVGLAILNNQTYRLFSGNVSPMFIPQATTVHFYFRNKYGLPQSGRLMFNYQDIILDEQHNIILARYDNNKFIG